jgi:SAM-dependent methyltransferase
MAQEFARKRNLSAFNQKIARKNLIFIARVRNHFRIEDKPFGGQFMGRALDFVKWNLGLGKEAQNFLGARWIVAFLRRVPLKSRRKWALRILNLSPHYFIDGKNPSFKKMRLDEYLEKSFEIIAASRQKLYRDVFKDYLESHQTVLEYGCGPGFLAKTVAPHVAKIFACDISTGAIACAEILNAGKNIEYLTASENDLSKIEDASLDLVFSFAVIQHLTDETFGIVLENCRRKLKTGGKIVFHIQSEDEIWKTEHDWRADKSLKGRVKFKYGLYCFGRTLEAHREIITGHGFIVREIKSLKFLDPLNASVGSQFLIIAERV